MKKLTFKLKHRLIYSKKSLASIFFLRKISLNSKSDSHLKRGRILCSIGNCIKSTTERAVDYFTPSQTKVLPSRTLNPNLSQAKIGKISYSCTSTKKMKKIIQYRLWRKIFRYPMIQKLKSTVYMFKEQISTTLKKRMKISYFN